MNGPLLVLDPGHGGASAAGASSANRGTSSTGLLEKDVALDLARRTRDRLVPDHVVVLTRDSDTNLTLAQRAETARTLRAAAFVSLHLSGGDAAVDRTDVVVPAQASAATRALAESLRSHVGAATGAAGAVLQADLGQIVPDRHDAATAACLVEIASLAPPQRAALLADPAYRDTVADALAAGIRAAISARAPVAVPQWVGSLSAGPRFGKAVPSVQRFGYSKEIFPPQVDPTYSVGGLVDAAGIWARWFAARAAWQVGVPDSALLAFPHAAICQLKLYDETGGLGYGTGFYIAPEVLLTCGHNFSGVSEGRAYRTVRVEVQPAYSPRMSTLASRTYDVDPAQVVHPRWAASRDSSYDLAVLAVPGLAATAGTFGLANVSLGQDQEIVVCGYGKVDDVPLDDQGQRMDGAHITESDMDIVRYPMMTKGGHSGSPVFHGSMVIGVHTHGDEARQLNGATLLTPEKEDWIVGKAGAGAGVRIGQTQGLFRALTDSSSTQAAQSEQVRLNVARSVGLAETSLRYDLVHDDSSRVNFGIGSWTGSRIADLLDTYSSYAAEQGLTDALTGHFGGQAGLDGIRTALRAGGAATVLSAAQRAQLVALGQDTALQPAQDRHLAHDIERDLAFVGSTGNPWYPFIDGGMGAISEIAAHVLTHARHQGPARVQGWIQGVIDDLGGDAAVGRAMVAGTLTERQFLERFSEKVVASVQARYATGVRNRYQRLFTDWGSSTLSYYFTPQS